MLRADQVADLLPRRAWQRASAGPCAEGKRLYNWAYTGLQPAPGAGCLNSCARLVTRF